LIRQLAILFLGSFSFASPGYPGFAIIVKFLPAININYFLKNANKHELNIVLCDRYYYSTIALQGAQGLSIKGMIQKNKQFRKPDIAFILDVEPSVALERIEYRQKEKFEQLEFMKRIRRNFLKMPKLLNDNIKIIDSTSSLKEVFNDVKKEVDRILV